MRPGLFIQSGIRGMEREEALRKISDLLPSSIVLFKPDFSSVKDLESLIMKISHIYVIDRGVPEPVIAVDQEGGNVVRLQWLDYNPSNLFLGELDDVNFTRYVGALTGYQLSQLGITWNLAPVLDLLNPNNQVILERSFGSDVIKVSRHGSAYVEGIQRYGVIATAKHFPGHGGVNEDSHLVLPRDNRSYESIINDAYPFLSAISSGVRSVMLSHVLYKEVDEDYPASISPKIQELLRKEFRFPGLIITDSVDMQAVSNHYDKKEVVMKTLRNEVDLIESADLNDSLELADIISNTELTNIKEKMDHITTMMKNHVGFHYEPSSDLLKAIEYTSPRVRRPVLLDPTKKFYIILLDSRPESKVYDQNDSLNGLMNEVSKLNIKAEFISGIDSLNALDRDSQFIFIGRNEHLKKRVWRINEFCEGKKCAFLSTGIDKDIGLFDTHIGYVSAFSQKEKVIAGSIAKLLQLF